MVIDRRIRRYCTDTESNDMIHLGMTTDLLLRIFDPRAQKTNGGLENTNQKQHLYKNTRYMRRSTSMESRKDPDSSETHKEIERRYDELEKKFIGKHEAAAHKESELLERQHTLTTAAATYVAGIPEQKYSATTVAIANEEARNT